MSNYDIRPQFECQNRILNGIIYYILPQFECQNMIEENGVSTRPDFECQKAKNK